MNFPKATQHVNRRHGIKTQAYLRLVVLYLPPCIVLEIVWEAEQGLHKYTQQ